jgi:hypothetical protein
MSEHLIDLTNHGILSIKELGREVTRASYSHPTFMLADAPVRVTESQVEAWEREIAERIDSYMYGSAPTGRPTTIYGHPLQVVEPFNFEGFVNRISQLANAEHEAEVRAAVVSSLPRRLRWLVDHPSLLRLLYRVQPSLRREAEQEIGRPNA